MQGCPVIATLVIDLVCNDLQIWTRFVNDYEDDKLRCYYWKGKQFMFVVYLLPLALTFLIFHNRQSLFQWVFIKFINSIINIVIFTVYIVYCGGCLMEKCDFYCKYMERYLLVWAAVWLIAWIIPCFTPLLCYHKPACSWNVNIICK